jgi:hypothetical protein
MPVIDENGNVGFHYWECGFPENPAIGGIDRSCTLFTRPVFQDGTVGEITRRPITFGEMVSHQTTLEYIKLHYGKK